VGSLSTAAALREEVPVAVREEAPAPVLVPTPVSVRAHARLARTGPTGLPGSGDAQDGGDESPLHRPYYGGPFLPLLPAPLVVGSRIKS
jgi:hypothetical protein